MRQSIIFLFVFVVGTASLAAAVIKRGDAVPAGAATPIATLLAHPEQYKSKPVVIEGLVEKACTAKGCWMQVVPSAGKGGMRVTFKDYAFFVPLNSAGMKARLQGTTSIKTLSRKEVDHLNGEGAKLAPKADGTADEVSFVAAGVELRK